MVQLYLQPLSYHHITKYEVEQAISEKKIASLVGKKKYFSKVAVWKRCEEGSVKKDKIYNVIDIALSHDKSIQNIWQNLIQPHKCSWMKTSDSMPLIMGVVNTTPDSFSDGGEFSDTEKAIEHAKNLIEQGAHCVDIGGESTRPGARAVDEAVERERVIPVIKGLSGCKAVLSVDTRKAIIMKEAINAGASVINDVSGLQFDKDSTDTLVQSHADVVLMHSSDIPELMQKNTTYTHVTFDVYDKLKNMVEKSVACGIDRKRIIIDPGIGFGKTPIQNLQLLKGLPIFHGLGCPILIGTSRKGFIGHVSNEENPQNRIAGTIATVLYSALHSAIDCVRVHDVKQIRQAFDMWDHLHNVEL